MPETEMPKEIAYRLIKVKSLAFSSAVSLTSCQDDLTLDGTPTLK